MARTNANVKRVAEAAKMVWEMFCVDVGAAAVADELEVIDPDAADAFRKLVVAEANAAADYADNADEG